MEDEKLIELVRKYEFLYNSQHPKYMDSARKDIAWKEISRQLRIPAAVCKQKWHCLRDSLRRALKKKRAKAGQVTKKIKKWRYEEEMAFVIPFFVERKPQESINTTSDDEESVKSYECPEFHSIMLENSNTNITVDDTVGESHKYTSKELREDVANSTTQTNNQHNETTKTVLVDSEQSAYALMVTNLLNEQKRHDGLDYFFLNISDTLRKFSPYLQAVAKRKIFAIVSDMEEQHFKPSHEVDIVKNESDTLSVE